MSVEKYQRDKVPKHKQAKFSYFRYNTIEGIFLKWDNMLWNFDTLLL